RDGLKQIRGVEKAAEALEMALTIVEAYHAFAHAYRGQIVSGAAGVGDVLRMGAKEGVIIGAKALAWKAFIHAMGDYAHKLDLRLEGYETMGDLLKDIERQTAAVDGTARQMDFLQGELDKAENLYNEPISGQPRQ
ncbi:MAG TPA: hypothetical protein VFO85_05955, partial [Vicinamibacteria bacterium]|nr:hypothetical protein [Vicinamibacteria bacterium]